VFNKRGFVALAALAAALLGCGVRPVTGGTKGVLRSGGAPLGDIQVTVHEADGSAWRAVGFGVTAADGTFELVTNGAAGPLWLSPGEYRCTLESVGAPVQIPKVNTLPDTTPLTVTWSVGDLSLNLEIPAVPKLR
jgi:hypothetical protein